MSYNQYSNARRQSPFSKVAGCILLLITFLIAIFGGMNTTLFNLTKSTIMWHKVNSTITTSRDTPAMSQHRYNNNTVSHDHHHHHSPPVKTTEATSTSNRLLESFQNSKKGGVIFFLHVPKTGVSKRNQI